MRFLIIAGLILPLLFVGACGGGNTTGFIVIPVLPLTGASPLMGFNAGGTAVTITGSGFLTGAGVTTVTFGGIAATGVLVINDTSLVAVTPPSPDRGPVVIQVSNANGTGSLIGANAFVYYAYPPLPALDWQLDFDNPNGNTDNPHALGGYPEVASAGQNVYAIWAEDRNANGTESDVWAAVSNDGGATWPPEFRVNTNPAGNGNSRFPSVAASGSYVYMAWVDNRTGQARVRFRSSVDAGLSFGPDMEIQTTGTWIPNWMGGIKSAPTVICSANLVVVSWVDDRNHPAPNGGDVYAVQSSDGGQTFSPATKVSSFPPNSGFQPAISGAADGLNFYLSWSDTRSGLWDVYMNRSANGGAGWLLVDQQVNIGGSNALLPTIRACGANVYVCWGDDRAQFPFGTREVYFRVSHDNGQNFLGPELRVSTPPSGFSLADAPYSMACAGQNVYITWNDNRLNGPTGGDNYYNVSYDAGASFQANDILVNVGSPNGVGLPAGLGSQPIPKVCASMENVHITWADNRNGGIFDIYTRSSPDAGTTWATTRMDTDVPNPGWSLFPAVSCNGPVPFVIWADRRNDPLPLPDLYDFAFGTYVW